jgi:arylsulfatase A-like enzyme
MPHLLSESGVYTHLVSDHTHYWEDGGATYHQRYDSWEMIRGQEADKWVGLVKAPETHHAHGICYPVQEKTRTVIRLESDFPQVRTFEAGLAFLERNRDADRWFLQVETFDPHEPFFAAQRFKDLFGLKDDSDWPMYVHTSEIRPEERLWYDEEIVDHYKALLSMCDDNLGKILDRMDEYDLWKDTMLIVNTDHGFLLGEHEFFGKCFSPFYNQVANTPLFVWDPREPVRNVIRDALVQTIDLAPTLLEYFEVQVPKDMLGKSVRPVIAQDEPIHDEILFGRHGEHIDITDGRYVYMMAPDPEKPFFEYTLMPMHIHEMFKAEEFEGAVLTPGFDFTKGFPVLKLRGQRWLAGDPTVDAYAVKDELYDLQQDPMQKNNLAPSRLDLVARFRMRIHEHLRRNDAPAELFERYPLRGN